VYALCYAETAGTTAGLDNDYYALMNSGLTTGDAYPIYSPGLSSATAIITNERAGNLEAIRVKIDTTVADATNIVVHFPISEIAKNDANGASNHAGLTQLGQFAIFYTINSDERYRYVHYAKSSIVWTDTVTNADLGWHTATTSTQYNNGESFSATISMKAATGKNLDNTDKLLVILPTGT
jgi:hypothetical protein